MTAIALNALSPYIAITAGLMVLLLAISFVRGHAVALLVTLVVLVAAGVLSLSISLSAGVQMIDEFFLIDGYTNFFNTLFLFAAIVTALVSYKYLDRRTVHREEFYVLLLTATLGAMAMAAAVHFAAFVLGLEILSISLYAMISYPEEGQAPLEAAIKYLVLSGVASTTLLFGMALVYSGTGTMEFSEALSGVGTNEVVMIGQGMILVGVAFKLSLVPFHMWTPDVYHGAPAPVTGFVATVSKGAVFAVLMRYVVETNVLMSDAMFFAVSLIAILSMVVGNLLALLQDNLKRILAYSSIAHIGYLLVALLVAARLGSPEMALETSMVYLVGYFLMTLAAFGVMTVLSTSPDTQDAESLGVYDGLFWRRPVLAAILTAAVLSLAGIPLTVGFIAKFYLFAAGVEASLWILLWALIIGSAIGVYYYMRIVFSMTKAPNGDTDRHPVASWEGLATVSVLGIMIVVLGVYPTPLIEIVREAIRVFGG
jgi:NADH-quinone oxidoreductase subunit N